MEEKSKNFQVKQKLLKKILFLQDKNLFKYIFSDSYLKKVKRLQKCVHKWFSYHFLYVISNKVKQTEEKVGSK